MPADPLSDVDRAELAPIVHAYQDVLPDLIGDAVNAGAFEDCVAAVATLSPHLIKGGADRLTPLVAVALIRLAQDQRRLADAEAERDWLLAEADAGTRARFHAMRRGGGAG